MVDYKTYTASMGYYIFLIASASVWCITKFINLLRRKSRKILLRTAIILFIVIYFMWMGYL